MSDIVIDVEIESQLYDSYDVENKVNTYPEYMKHVHNVATILQKIRGYKNKKNPEKKDVKEPESQSESLPNSFQPRTTENENESNVDEDSILENNSDTSWNIEIERQFFDYSELCKISSRKCQNQSQKHKNMTITYKFVSSVISALMAISSIIPSSTDIKNTITIVGGVIGFLIPPITFLFNPTKKATMEQEVSIELNKISMFVKLELSKPRISRQDPLELIIKLSTQRDKLLQKVNMQDIE